MNRTRLIAERRARVAQLREQGLTVPVIAVRLGTTERAIYSDIRWLKAQP